MIQSRLSILMAERGLKISELYEETGISKTTLMAIAENSGKGVQFETVDKLCNYLGVTPCEFFDYSPYLVEMDLIESDFYNDQLKDFNIKIRNQNYEKDFMLRTAIQNGDSYDIPVRTGEFDYYISVYLEGSDHYTDKEFFNFLSNMSISFRTEFIKNLISNIKNQLKNLVKNKVSVQLMGEMELTTLNENGYIALKLFEDSEFETLKKLHIK